MSKFLNIPTGNYTVKVQPGGEIRLDTGIEEGSVVITGDLVVEGNTTTVESENMVVKDNIIVVNDGETGSGISLTEAGIRVDRGTLTDSLLVFDESFDWVEPNSNTTVTGGWHLKYSGSSGSTVALKTQSIETGFTSNPGSSNTDLFVGTRLIRVPGNYENYVDENEPSHIPNVGWVTDYVTSSITTSFRDRIEEGSTSKTFVEVVDFEVTGTDSRIEFGVNDTIEMQIQEDRVNINNIGITNTSIFPVVSNEDLVLIAPGTGSIRIDDSLIINSVPSIDDPALEPVAPIDGLKLYVSDESTGNTGLFFVNQQSTRDEIISRNRSLVFSMIF